jgi:hypothetical protein
MNSSRRPRSQRTSCRALWGAPPDKGAGWSWAVTGTGVLALARREMLRYATPLAGSRRRHATLLLLA